MMWLKLKHRFRIAKIKTQMYYELTRLSLSGLLIRSAFWISPRLEFELSKGFKPRRRFNAD